VCHNELTVSATSFGEHNALHGMTNREIIGQTKQSLTMSSLDSRGSGPDNQALTLVNDE
jgi:hypothetical protein